MYMYVCVAVCVNEREWESTVIPDEHPVVSICVSLIATPSQYQTKQYTILLSIVNVVDNYILYLYNLRQALHENKSTIASTVAKCVSATAEGQILVSITIQYVWPLVIITTMATKSRKGDVTSKKCCYWAKETAQGLRC